MSPVAKSVPLPEGSSIPTDPMKERAAPDPGQPDVRERILDAAEALLTNGSPDFTMERVAERADVSRTTVYRRFGSVDGLKRALEEERDASSPVADTRTRILDAALDEFTRSGVHGATVQEIADRAGVTPMTVYNHFEDKEGLVASLIGERGPIGLPFHRFASTGDARDTVTAFVKAAVQLVVDQRDLLGLVIAPDPITRRAFRRVRGGADDAGTALETLLASTDLPEGIDPRVAAACLMGMVIANAAIRPLLFGEEVDDVDELSDQICRLFTRAVELDG